MPPKNKVLQTDKQAIQISRKENITCSGKVRKFSTNEAYHILEKLRSKGNKQRPYYKALGKSW